MRWSVVVLIAGCSSGDEPVPQPMPARIEPPSQPPTPTPTPTPQPGVRRGRMHATWSHVVTTDACWYFSGPEGRDTKLAGDVELERDGDTMRMTWGNATFTGTFKADELVLRRRTSHDFDGAWRVDEEIRGKYVEGAIRAKYRYEECEHDTPCPNQCTIAATLDLVR